MINIPTILPTELKDKYDAVNNTFIRKDKGEKAEEREVEIGDVYSCGFQPQVKLKQWDNETNFSVRLIDDEPTKPTIKTEDNKVKFIKKNREAHFYDIEKGFEFEVLLKKKPKTNKVEFTTQSKGLKFYKQPPLTEEFKSGYSEEFKKEIIVTETDVKDLEGNVLVHRPIEIVNSFAVYHESKAGDYSKMGKKNYRAGKAMHMPFPYLIDANGWKVRAESFNIDTENNLLTVVAPQDFIDNAVYPVRHAAGLTFGTDPESPGGSYSTKNDDYFWGFRPHAPASSGTLDDINVYTGWVDNQKIRGAVYKDSDDSRIDQSAELGFSGSGWRTMTLNSQDVVSSTDYILTIWQDVNSTIAYDSTAGFYTAYKGLTYHSTNDFPATMAWAGKTGYSGERYSIYCTYTAAGVEFTPKAMFFTFLLAFLTSLTLLI